MFWLLYKGNKLLSVLASDLTMEAFKSEHSKYD